MKINKNSWHYRLLQYTNRFWDYNGELENKWAWYTVGVICVRQLLPGGKESTTTPEPSNLCMYFWSVVLSTISLPLILLISLVILVAGAILTGVFAAFFFPIHAIKTRHDIKVEAGKDPNILFEFAKAKKKKICPLITYVD